MLAYQNQPARVFFNSRGRKLLLHAAITLSNLSGTLGHWFSYFRSSSRSCCYLIHTCRFMFIGFPIFSDVHGHACRPRRSFTAPFALTCSCICRHSHAIRLYFEDATPPASDVGAARRADVAGGRGGLGRLRR